jgi:peptidoglycan/LPS O-acetylase OafA/YrhL
MHLESKNKRFLELDALRGIAAVSVVLFHFTFGYDNGLKILTDNHFYFKYGYLGVKLFFIISGFVIIMTLEKTLKTTDFIVARFSRLYPAYWAAIFITILMTSLLSVPFQEDIYSMSQVIINLTMLQYYFKVKDVDGAYWTLAIELMFYCLIYFIYNFKKGRLVEFFLVIWMLLCCIYNAFEMPFGSYIKVLFILKHAPLFIAGISFYLVSVKRKIILNNGIVILSLVVEFFLLSCDKSDLIIYSIIAVFYITFYLFIYSKLNFIVNRISLFFGAISYPLYLIHENIGLAMIYKIKLVFDSQIVFVSLTFLFVIVLAYLISVFIEKPFQYFLRYIFNLKTKQ